VKFLIDMALSPELVEWLVRRGHVAVHAFKVGLGEASDSTILEYAHNEQRVIITADLDYPRLLALVGADGPGLILFRGGNYSEQEVLEHLGRMFETISEEEIINSVVVIEKNRIRKRRLPLKVNT